MNELKMSAYAAPTYAYQHTGIFRPGAVDREVILGVNKKFFFQQIILIFALLSLKILPASFEGNFWAKHHKSQILKRLYKLLKE